MKLFILFGTCALLLGAATSPPATAATAATPCDLSVGLDDQAASAEELLRRSGAWHGFNGVASEIEQAILKGDSASKNAPSAAELERLHDLLQLAYAPQLMRRNMLHFMAPQLTQEDFCASLIWFDSPQGKEIARLEEEFMVNPSSVIAAALNKDLEPKKAMTPTRKNLMKELLRATNAVSGGADVMILTVTGIRLGTAYISAEKSKIPSVDSLRTLPEAERTVFEQLSLWAAETLYAQLYGKVTDDNLKLYVNFLNSPAGRRWVVLNDFAMSHAYVQAAQDLSHAIQRRQP